MYINFKCDDCKEVSPTSCEQLYHIWKTGYDSTPEDKREGIFLTAEIRCTCGTHSKFESPMFKHMFDVVFQEFRSLEEE
jgi:hypothetical protein